MTGDELAYSFGVSHVSLHVPRRFSSLFTYKTLGCALSSTKPYRWVLECPSDPVMCGRFSGRLSNNNYNLELEQTVERHRQHVIGGEDGALRQCVAAGMFDSRFPRMLLIPFVKDFIPPGELTMQHVESIYKEALYPGTDLTEICVHEMVRDYNNQGSLLEKDWIKLN